MTLYILNDPSDWSKVLLLGTPHVISDPRQNGRLEEVASRTFPSTDDLRPLTNGILYLGLDLKIERQHQCNFNNNNL